MKKTPRKKILAISVFVASILLTSCSSSIKSESNQNKISSDKKAIKYLSRYDKKGQAKRDILKALHYSLLLYHFSGQLNETPTRGYETF